MKKLSLITLLLLLIAGAGAGSGYWFLVLEADEDETEQENRAPQATISTSPADGQVRVDETVSFQGHQSSDPDGDPLTYAWDFGDDNSSSGLTVSHAYGIEGAYTVRLTVTDPAGLNDFAEKVITVTEPQVETFQGDGTVSCQITTGNCDTEEVAFEVKPDAALASVQFEDEKPSGEHSEDRYVGPIAVTGDGPLVVREKTHPASPMTLDQALYEMELVGHDFFLYVDKESERPAVVYRRRGYDYGVISLDLGGE